MLATVIGWFPIDRLSLTAETWPMAINQGVPRCLKYQQSKQTQTKLSHISITKRLHAPLGGGSWSERPGLLPQLIRARIVWGQLAVR